MLNDMLKMLLSGRMHQQGGMTLPTGQRWMPPTPAAPPPTSAPVIMPPQPGLGQLSKDVKAQRAGMLPSREMGQSMMKMPQAPVTLEDVLMAREQGLQ